MDLFSITSSKQRFLRTQVRLLSAPLAPSHDWRDHDGQLSDKAVKEVLQKVNVLLRRHNRAVYFSQALRHAAERIDRLYWTSGNVRKDGAAEEIVGALHRGTNFRDHDQITSLPPTWPQHLQTPDQSGLETFAESRRYANLRARLTRLSERKKEQDQQLVQLKYLQQLMIPFENPRESIQPNLATKDGELGRELERMRVLMARAKEMVEGMPEVRAGDCEVDVVVGGKEHLAAMFDGHTEVTESGLG